MQLQPEQRSRLLCRVIIFELSKFPFLSLFFLANFFEKGNTSGNCNIKTNQTTKMRCFSTFNRGVNKVTHNTILNIVSA